MGLALAACTKPVPRWLHMSFTQHGPEIWEVWLLSKPIGVSRQVCVELSWNLPTCVNERTAKLTAFLVVRILYDNPWPAISVSMFLAVHPEITSKIIREWLGDGYGSVSEAKSPVHADREFVCVPRKPKGWFYRLIKGVWNRCHVKWLPCESAHLCSGWKWVCVGSSPNEGCT